MNQKKLRVLGARILLPFFFVWCCFAPFQATAQALPVFPSLGVVGISSSASAASFPGAVAANSGSFAAGVASVGAVDLLAGAALVAVGAYLGYTIVGALAGDGTMARIPLTSAPSLAVPPPSAPSSASQITSYTFTAGLYSSYGSGSTSAAACQNLVSKLSGWYMVTSCSDTALSLCYETAQNSNTCSATVYSSPATTMTKAPNAPTCPAGYTVSGSSCVLSDARAASPDKACDYQVSAGTLSPYSGDSVDCAGATPKPVWANGSLQTAGLNGAGNPFIVTVTPTAAGGSVVTVQQQTTVNGQSVLNTNAITVSPQGVVEGNNSSSVAGSITLSPTNQTGTATSNPNPAPAPPIQFPTDYARQGEAAAAAGVLSPKLDTLHADNTATNSKLDTVNQNLQVTPSGPINNNESQDTQNLSRPPTIPTFDAGGLSGTVPLPASPGACTPATYAFFGGRTITYDFCQYHAAWHGFVNAGVFFMGTIATLRVLFAREDEEAS